MTAQNTPAPATTADPSIALAQRARTLFLRAYKVVNALRDDLPDSFAIAFEELRGEVKQTVMTEASGVHVEATTWMGYLGWLSDMCHDDGMPNPFDDAEADALRAEVDRYSTRH